MGDPLWNPPTSVTGRRADTVAVVASLSGSHRTCVGYVYSHLDSKCLNKLWPNRNVRAVWQVYCPTGVIKEWADEGAQSSLKKPLLGRMRKDSKRIRHIEFPSETASSFLRLAE